MITLSTLNSADATLQRKHARKTLTLTGAANLGQSASVITIFTITGRVILDDLVAVCTTNLTSAGGGTLALGVAGNTGGLVAATTATDITTTNLIWETATPTAGLLAIPAAEKLDVVTSNIIGTVAVADITAGVIVFDVFYYPLTDTGLLA